MCVFSIKYDQSQFPGAKLALLHLVLCLCPLGLFIWMSTYYIVSLC